MSTLLRLNAEQQRALDEIDDARAPGDRHLLTGYAGSGKTTTVEGYARRTLARGNKIVLSAPTHKATAVLRRRMTRAGLHDVPCRTLASLLSLRPEVVADREVYVRNKRAEPVTEDVVVIDECSMIGEEVMAHIRRYLPLNFTLFVGDPAQLPPVGEVASQSFMCNSRSHLGTVVRQAAGNPVLAAAHIIRESQGAGVMDWSWCATAKAVPYGVFRPGNADAWMQHAFTSQAFRDDPDSFRFLCWTNARAETINQRVRRWIYGPDVSLPFMPNERAMLKKPLVCGGTLMLNTNEEVTVRDIRPGRFRFAFKERDTVAAWVAELAAYEIEIERDDGTVLSAFLCRDERGRQRIIDQATDEATYSRSRWQDRADFISSLLRIEPIYALTVHASQGSTFGNVFIDVPDIRRRVESNLLEAQQLFYVAATRPTHALVLIGAP